MQNPYPATLSRDAQARGVAVFAVAYVPLPISNLDFDAKAGLSRLDVTESQTYTPIPIDTCLHLLPLPPNPGCTSLTWCCVLTLNASLPSATILDVAILALPFLGVSWEITNNTIVGRPVRHVFPPAAKCLRGRWG